MFFVQYSSADFAAYLHGIERESFVCAIGSNSERAFVAAEIYGKLGDFIHIAVAFVRNAYGMNSERFRKRFDNCVFVGRLISGDYIACWSALENVLVSLYVVVYVFNQRVFKKTAVFTFKMNFAVANENKFIQFYYLSELVFFVPVPLQRRRFRLLCFRAKD